MLARFSKYDFWIPEQILVRKLDTTLQGREARSLARFVIPGCPSAVSVTCPHVTLRTTETVPISCWGTVDYPNVAFLKHFAKKVPPKWLQNGTPKVPTLSLNLTFWDVFFENLQNHDFKLPVGTSMWSFTQNKVFNCRFFTNVRAVCAVGALST